MTDQNYSRGSSRRLLRGGALQTILRFVAAEPCETNDKLTSHEPVDNYARWLK